MFIEDIYELVGSTGIEANKDVAMYVIETTEDFAAWFDALPRTVAFRITADKSSQAKDIKKAKTLLAAME